MKRLLTVTVIILAPLFVFSQDLAGLWQGTMMNDSAKTSLPYELLIKKEKNKYTGFSYTYFQINGEQYYGVKEVKISVAKDGKIVIVDDKLIGNDYPIPHDIAVKQLNVLDLVNKDNENALDGLFVTNATKKYKEVTGHINVKKVSETSSSTLVAYLDKKNALNQIASK